MALQWNCYINQLLSHYFFQIISPYSVPDTNELYYHAGTATRSSNRYIKVKLLGVTCCDKQADKIAAILLVASCRDPSISISRVKVDTLFSSQDIYSYMKNKTTSFHLSIGNSDHYKSVVEKIQLLCVCLTPWIDGSTSKAIYQEKQKEYNVYQCSHCKNWYHKYCLKYCGVKVPGRFDDFVCFQCDLPDTVPWATQGFTDTCTTDNFFSILLLHCLQHPEFISLMGKSAVENALKAGLKLMIGGQIIEGKQVILQHLQSESSAPKYSFYGHEFDEILSFFRHVWRVRIIKKCPSPVCPRGAEEVRKVCHFSFSSKVTTSFTHQLREQFPDIGDRLGVCCAEFSQQPPCGSVYGINSRLSNEEDELVTESYYECREYPKVQEAYFLHSNHWMIPINISELSGLQCTKLPKGISVFGNIYRLGGYSVHTPGHYCGVIRWHGRELYYDGLGKTKEQRLQGLKSKNIKHKNGSFAYYFRCSH